VERKAAERLRALEHPAIDVLARFLTPPEQATTLSAIPQPSTVLNAAKMSSTGPGTSRPTSSKFRPSRPSM
jgi:hypothetical protein